MLEINSFANVKLKIVNKIAQGSKSKIYLAMNELTNKKYAIKEIRIDGKTDYEKLRNIVAETDFFMKLNHPLFPKIFDIIDCKDSILIVMDYIEGRPLDTVLKKEGIQSQEKVVEWAKQICDVLNYLHSFNPPVLYHDMKPSNILLKPNGKISVMYPYNWQNHNDTTYYGEKADIRYDIYRLGTTMHYLLTGHNPNLPPNEIRPIRSINPKLSNGLERIILKCTQKDLTLRYQNCAEMMYDLEHYKEVDLEYARKQKNRLYTLIALVVVMILIFLSIIVVAIKYKKIVLLVIAFIMALILVSLITLFVVGNYNKKKTRKKKKKKIQQTISSPTVPKIETIKKQPYIGDAKTEDLSNKSYHAYLTRMKNSERIYIDIQNFKIGRDPSKVNYCISDNMYISDFHCKIVCQGYDYYVIDNGTMNTYVNGIQALPNKKTILMDGSSLKLCDEEFEFHR